MSGAQELYPVIEQDGSFTEVRIPIGLRSPYWPRTKFRNPLLVEIDEVSTEVEMFELMPFAFEISRGRLAEVYIYVDVRFKSESNDARRKEIERFVHDRSAWIFTYGKRTTHEVYG